MRFQSVAVHHDKCLAACIEGQPVGADLLKCVLLYECEC